MGAKANAKVKSPVFATDKENAVAMSGHQPNGSIHHAHAHGSRSTRAKRRGQKTYAGWAVDKAAKLLVWYTLATVLFRCPSTQQQLQDTTPRICKPYLQARDVVTPHAQPYYDQYVSPYVQQARPYYDYVNEKAYQPAYGAYERYGAPRVAQAQKAGAQQWQKTLKPTLDFAQKQAAAQYQKALAPHVKRVTDIVQPYYENLVTSASDIWELELEPVYRKTAPYAHKIYMSGQAFAMNTALPEVQLFGSSAWSLWSRQVWPKLRILYGENVEPQLTRITERLGRYKDGKKLEAEIVSIENSSKAVKASSTAESIASSVASTFSEATESPSSAATAADHHTPAPSIDPAVHFQEDLKSWEHICAKAVEEGAEDLTDRIEDIAARQISRSEKLGRALVTQLEQTTESALNSVKSRIQQIVRGLPEDASEEQVESANEDVVQAVRAAGQNIKQRAQAVREWKQTSQSETQSLTAKALESTLETIDSIRELRLTEIGRKYASSSLPHKEWSKYNDIKKATQSWRNDVERAAREHKALAAAKAAGEETEQTAMAIAEAAAKELGRLKKVGQWKIAANDESDDFTTKTVPPPVKKVKDQVVEKAAEASEAVFGSEHDTAKSAASKASSKIIGSQPAADSVKSEASKSASSASSKVSASASSVASAASSAVVGESKFSDPIKDAASSASSAVVGESVLSDTIKASASSVNDEAQKLASKLKSKASSNSGIKKSIQASISSAQDAAKSAVLDEPLGDRSVGGKLASILSEQKENASKNVESAASGVSSTASSVASAVTSTPLASEISNSVSSASSAASSKISSASKDLPSAEDIADAADAYAQKPQKVFAGAMAQVIVEAREPILDDDNVDLQSSYSASIQQIINAAGEKGSQLTQAIQDAMSSATATQGNFESATSLANEQYESALSAASSALFGTQNGVDRATSAVQDQYQAAVTAASWAIYGAPVTAAPLAAASSAYDRSISEASKQYDAIRSRVAEQYSAAPDQQQLFASAESAYSSAITAASYAIYGTPVTVAPFAAASSAYVDAVNDASKHYEAVKARVSEQVSGTPEPVHEQVLESARSAYSNAVGAASSALNDAFSPTTQNYYESVSSVAASRLSEGLSAAQEQFQSAKIAIGAEPTPAHQQYLASAQAAYYQALGLAHGRYTEFVEAASSIVGPTPTATGYQASIDSMLDAAKSAYSDYTKEASSKYSVLYEMASHAADAQSTTVGKGTLDDLQGQLVDAVASAKSKLSIASASVSSAYLEQSVTDKPVASQASENWEALIAKASEQIYGAPPPFTAQAYSLASEYAASATDVAAQATQAAAAQWDQINSLFGELVVGKEPDFTASVYSRLQSAYSTGAPAIASQVSSYASDTYSSVSSVVSAAFVPPTQVPGILEQVQAQLNEAVDRASAQVYGTTKGTVEQATEAAASLYSDAASQVSEAIYGTPAPLLESAQSSIVDIGASASSAISIALYGQPTAPVAAAGSAASSVASSIQSKAAEQAASASAAISSAVYGEEQTYLEGVQSQLSVAMASASSRLAELGGDARQAAEQAASTASSKVSQATDRIRDEL